MAINWSNTANENSENNRSVRVDAKNKFLDDYFKSKTLDSSFLNSIFGDDSESHLIIKELEEELKKWKESDVLLGKNEYDGIYIEKSDLSYFKIRLISEFNRLQSKRKDLENYLINDYELSSSEINKIENEIKSLSDKDLDKLINGKNERRVFLKKIFADKLPEIKYKWFFNKYLNFTNKSLIELDKIFNKDPELLKILQRLDSRDKRVLMTNSESNDFLYLIKSSYLSDEEKKKLILDYLPQVSFESAKKIWIIWDILEFKKKILIKYFGDKYSDEELKELLNDDKTFDTITIETSDLLENNSSILWNEDFLKLFADKYCSHNNTLLEEYLSKLDNNIDWFRKKIDNLSNVDWWLKFTIGSYLVIEKELVSDNKKKDDKTDIDTDNVNDNSNVSYIKIISDWSIDWIIKYYDLWTWKIIINSKVENETAYEPFLNFLKSGNDKLWIKSVKKCNILNKQEIDSLISKWIITESILNLDLVSETELDKIISEKEADLVRLKEDKGLEYSRQWLSWESLIDKINNDPDVIELQWVVRNTQETNLNFLKDELRNIDWWFDNYKFWVWTTFSTKKSNWESFYTIEYIDELTQGGIIRISDIYWNHYDDFHFIDFLKAFKDQWWFLTTDIKSFEEIFTKISSEDDKTKSWWDKFKFDEWSWSILKKSSNMENADDNTKIEYDYLVADSESWKWNELIKIHSINGNKVRVSAWECIDTDYTKEEKEADRTLEWKMKSEFSVSDTVEEMTVWELYSRIKKYKLKPRSLDENKDQIQEKIKKANIKWSIISRFLDNYSIKDILAGWKIWIDSITVYLKQTEDEHSARFANSVFWSFLPSELKNDLQTRLEWSQKKRQDEYIQKLKDVDSSDATSMIIGRLENKDSPEYKKEAWMIFMLEKYGVLYAKGLNSKKWTFLWYEAMWWKVWDKLYREKKLEAEENDVPFTEEQLLYVLMILQCNWKMKPKRRSRLHKDYNSFRNRWKEEEAKTWEIDASNRRTIKWRNEYVFWELIWWTYPNARGWYNKVIDKWWPMSILNEVPFVMLFSWIAYWYEESELDKWKDLVEKWKLIPIAQFLWNKSKMDLFNNTVLEVCKIIWTEKNNNMYSDAKVIFWTQKNVEWDKAKIERTKEFYKKYWKVLTNTLNMLHNTDVWEDSKYSDLIITHKDKVWNREWNQILKDYFKTFHGWLDFSFDKEEYMTDAFHSAWTFWMDPEKATIDALALASWPTLRQKNIAPILWNEVINGFRAKAVRSYNSEEDKKKAIQHILRWLITWILKNAWAGGLLDSYNKDTFLFSRLNDWWVYLGEVGIRNLTIENFKNKEANAESLLDKWVDQIIDFETNNKSYRKSSSHEIKNIKDEIPAITDVTKGETFKVLNDSKYLPSDYKKAA